MLRARDVIRLHMGHYTVPGDFPRAPHLQNAVIVVTAFLVRHPDGAILLDTGLASGHAKAEAVFHPVIRPFDDVLREAALRPETTRAIANCHLHVDHSGNNFRFPKVPIFVQRSEHEAAGTTLDYSLPEKTIAFPDARLELLDGEEAEIAPGVRVIPTPGHTAGHQSFVVDTQEGRIVIAGQAYNDATEYARALYAWRLDRDGQPHPDYAPWVARLQELDPWRITFAHDLAIWERGA
ncbi:MAG TPA: MBL fold metallo-hydrolase [Candidatus Limnocylindria bacterium]|nr:MBL fold metallo-hydrolase [Candidatus Limnocylindria bacterium]